MARAKLRRKQMLWWLASIVASLLLGLAVALITVLGSFSELSADICTTPQCYERSEFIRSAMNNSVSPCEDFYEYACGGWIANAYLPSDHNVVDLFTLLSNRIRRLLNNSLSTRPVDRENLTNAVDKAAFLVQQCINFDATVSENDSLVQFKAALDAVGQMPLFSPDWDASTFDRDEFVAKVIGVSLDNFLSVDVLPDEKNSSINRISVYQPSPFIQKTYLLNKNSTSFIAYRKYTITVLTDLCNAFSPTSLPEVSKDVDEILEFERRMASWMLESADMVDFTKLLTLLRFADLNTSLKNILNTLVRRRVGHNIDDDEEIQFVLGTRFANGFVKILDKTSERTLANFGMWAVIRGVLHNALPQRLRAHDEPLWLADQGSKPHPRWKTCLTTADSYYKMAVGRIYIDEHFDKNIKLEVTEIVSYVKSAFLKHSIQDNDWLDKETKAAAAEKLLALRLAIAYPDYIVDDQALNALYSNFPDRGAESFAYYVLLCAIANTNTLIDTWSAKIVDRSLWVLSPHQVQAYFDHSRNLVGMLAAILASPPFYQQHVPQALNYGAIGWVIGHEISHAFDSNGRAYDKDGNLRNWWKSNASSQSFEKRGQCIVEQYSRMCYPNLPPPTRCINGNLTKAENIADLGGMPSAYKAYQNWKSNMGSDKKLPGLGHLTDEQLFFIGMANIWCERHTQQHLTLHLLSDAHSPGKFRVNGVLWGMPEFAKAFKCAKGSAMNPANASQCKVW